MHKSITAAFIATALVSVGAVAKAQTIPAQHPAQHSAHHAAPYQGHLVEIRMDDDFKPETRTSYGKLEGYDPVVVAVHRGHRIRFVNVDDIAHTATGYAFGGQQIPANYKFQGDPSTPHGSSIDRSEWSTGNVAPHSRSRVFSVNGTGTFYFADAYHQGNMRGAIVVK